LEVNDLDGEAAADLWVGGLVDDAHTAAAQLVGDDVSAELQRGMGIFAFWHSATVYSHEMSKSTGVVRYPV
jgi:hypothetical protein